MFRLVNCSEHPNLTGYRPVTLVNIPTLLLPKVLSSLVNLKQPFSTRVLPGFVRGALTKCLQTAPNCPKNLHKPVGGSSLPSCYPKATGFHWTTFQPFASHRPTIGFLKIADIIGRQEGHKAPAEHPCLRLPPPPFLSALGWHELSGGEKMGEKKC